jgi:hypothetical protein
MTGFVERMMGAARLDVRIYEEVEADRSAMAQAMGVVVLSSVAAGIGAARGGALALLMGTLAALLGWFIWAWVTWFIGTKVLPEPRTSADIGQLLRTTGFSASPGLLRILGVIPWVGSLIVLAASVWMLVAMVVAVRQALDYSGTGRAIGVCLLGFLVNVLLVFAVGFFFAAFGVAAGSL